METEKKLLVNDLTVSFRTPQGLVRAVRGIDFDLSEGETLAIVGESGSGKSVSCRTIMGILAGNAIIDKGTIIYEGQDLTKLREDEFHKIRGHKIGMIFQDPMSSLNPIMKIGKQITEGMLVNGKRLKNKYKEMVHKYLVDYKNAKIEKKSVIKTFKINKSQLKKDDKRHEITKLKSQFSNDLIELNKKIKNAKLAIKKQKKHAKKAVAEDWKAEQIRVKTEIKKLNVQIKLNKIELSKDKERKQVIINEIKNLKDNLKRFNKEAKKAFTEKCKTEKKRVAKEIKLGKQKKQSMVKEINKEISVLTRKFKDASDENKQTLRNEIQSLKTRVEDTKESTILEIETINENLKLFNKEAKRTITEELKAEKNRVVEEINKLNGTQKNNLLKTEIETLEENLRRYKKVTRKEAKERAIKVMEEVGIPQPHKRLKQYPFQFSGGMRQRIVIAIALTANPDVLICDEPTTALDVTIQAQILDLIKQLKTERKLSVIFITHDLGVVANMADRVAVMYAGKIVEIGKSEEIFYNPKHPYTWALLSSMPDLNSTDRLTAIPGTPPNMLFPPKGDAFAARSKYAMKIDFEKEPPFFKVSDTHYAATWLLHKDSPKVEMPKIIQERIDNMTKAPKEVNN